MRPTILEEIGRGGGDERERRKSSLEAKADRQISPFPVFLFDTLGSIV
jgi:hypothetical protein